MNNASTLYPQTRWHRCDDERPRKSKTICAPCQIRHLLPQLLPLRNVRGAGKSRPFLSIATPLQRFPRCKCADEDWDDLYWDYDYFRENYSAAEHPNAWRRWVREWHRQVNAKCSIHSAVSPSGRFEGQRQSNRHPK